MTPRRYYVVLTSTGGRWLCVEGDLTRSEFRRYVPWLAAQGITVLRKATRQEARALKERGRIAEVLT